MVPMLSYGARYACVCVCVFYSVYSIFIIQGAEDRQGIETFFLINEFYIPIIQLESADNSLLIYISFAAT